MTMDSFAVFDSRIAADTQLHDSDRRVYLALCAFGAWKDYVEVSARQLASEAHLALSTVYAALRRLVEHGYIERVAYGARKRSYHAHVAEVHS